MNLHDARVMNVPQQAIAPRTDLREMLRGHIVRLALACMARADYLRGWGDTAPAMYPYEMAGWGSLDRYTAYATAALGDPLMAMRVRDALAALAWLRTRPEVAPDRIVLTGSGLGGAVALHVAAIDADIAGVVVLDGLSSFHSLLAATHYPWPADAFVPGVLRHYDLPQLAAAIPAPVHLHNLRDGAGHAADEAECAAWRAAGNVSFAQPFHLPDVVTALAATRDATSIT